MSFTDPIADMLTRIRNAVSAKHDSVTIPCSKEKLEIAKILKSEGFITDFTVEGETKKEIVITLKYVANGKTQATNVTVETYSITDSKGATADTSSGTFNAFTVMDDTDYYVSCSVNHTAGDVPKTYLGEDYAAAQIKAGTKTNDSLHVTGYRQGFFGALETKSGEINSELIRGLVGKTNKKVGKGQQYTITVPAGVLRIVLAYEASVGDVASITSAEEFGSEIKDSFTKSVVSVLDASGANGKDYNVYVKDLAGAQGTDTTYTVTI